MKTPVKSIVFFIFMTCLSLSTYGQDKEDIWAPREKMEQLTMRGTVTEINADTREITLMDTEGGLNTVKVGEEVKRFDEIAVGDVIEFDYYMYIKAEFREPTAEELEEPVQMVVEEGIAPEDMSPGAAVGAVIKAVVTIEALNRPNMIATVSGPNGNFVSIPMEDAEFMTKLRIGQVLILTYAEAMAVSLEKVAEANKS